MVCTLKYDCLYHLLSGNKELGEIGIDIHVQVTQFCFLSLHPGYVRAEIKSKPSLCGFFFFFLNDFIHCWKENVFGSGAEVLMETVILHSDWLVKGGQVCVAVLSVMHARNAVGSFRTCTAGESTESLFILLIPNVSWAFSQDSFNFFMC